MDSVFFFQSKNVSDNTNEKFLLWSKDFTKIIKCKGVGINSQDQGGLTTVVNYNRQKN